MPHYVPRIPLLELPVRVIGHARAIISVSVSAVNYYGEVGEALTLCAHAAEKPKPAAAYRKVRSSYVPWMSKLIAI